MTARSFVRSTLARLLVGSLAVAVLAGAVGCAESPEIAKQRHLKNGEAHLKAGRYGEAIIELRNALQKDPDLLPALHALGRAYAAKAWHYDAIRELSRAKKKRPDNPAILVDLGRSLAEVGAWEEVAETADTILLREPSNPDGLYLRVV